MIRPQLAATKGLMTNSLNPLSIAANGLNINGVVFNLTRIIGSNNNEKEKQLNKLKMEDEEVMKIIEFIASEIL